MATLTSQLVVSLVDRTGAGARGVLRNMGMLKAANAGAATMINQTTSAVRQQSRTMRAFRTIAGHTPGMGSMIGAGGAYSFLKNEYEYQAAMNRTQAVLNETDDKAFSPHRDLVVDLAKRYPATSAEIAKGASELAMAGMSMEQVNAVLEATVQGALATGESIKNVGMGVTDVALGLGMRLTKENFEELNNIMAAANTAYSQDYMAFLQGFYKTAPIARMIGMDVKQLAGYLGILADAGFKAEKGGTALRTSIINAAAPTPKAAAQLEKYGIQIDKFKKRVDTFQLGGRQGAETLADLIAAELGVDLAEGLDAAVLPVLSDQKAFADPAKLKKRLTAAITGALGVDDPENSKLIAESVHRFVESGFQQLDFDALLKEMGEKGFDKDLVAMDAVFKKRFAAPMGAVINSLRDGTFDAKMDVFLPRIAGAVQRFADILMKGLPGAVQRLAGAFDGLMRAMASSGAIDTVVEAMNSLRDGINWLSETNPTVLKGLTLAMLGMGLLAPVGFVLMGVAASFTVLGSALRFAVTPIRLAAKALSMLGKSGAAASGAAGLAGLFGVGAGGVAAGLTAKEAGKALGRMGSATASSQMIAGMSAAGAAAGTAGTAAAKGGWLKALGRFGLRSLPGVATAYGLYELGSYLWGGSEAQAAEPVPAANQADVGAIESTAAELPVVVSNAMAQVQSLLAAVDLTAEGQRIMQTLANGMRAGIPAIQAAGSAAAAAAANSALRGAYTDGGR